MNRKWLDFIKENEFRGMRIGAEVGVYTGQDALRICQELPILHLYLIDPYQKYEGYTDFPPEGGLKISPQNAKKEVIELLKPFDDKIKWIFKKFEECSDNDIPESLDFIYIDGNHTYEYVKEDIRLATVFVKEGGVVGGHDYQMKGVKKAVDEYIQKYNLGSPVSYDVAPGERCMDWYFINKKTRQAHDNGEIYKNPKPWQIPRYNKVAKILPEDKNIKILDMGCREAYFGDVLYEMGYHNYWGIDKNQDAISFAHKKGKLGQNFILGNLLHPKTQEMYEKFDVFVLMELLEHLPNDDDIKVLQSIPTRKIIIITVPVEPYLPENHEHVRGMQTIEEISIRYRFIFGSDYEIEKWQYPNSASSLFIFKGIRK